MGSDLSCKPNPIPPSSRHPLLAQGATGELAVNKKVHGSRKWPNALCNTKVTLVKKQAKVVIRGPSRAFVPSTLHRQSGPEACWQLPAWG